jgi:hypothetical protein
MKKIFFTVALFALAGSASAQEFAKQLTTARSSYSSGKLNDSRFAMQQMLQELDIITGKELLKILPQNWKIKPLLHRKTMYPAHRVGPAWWFTASTARRTRAWNWR